ncbi:MAG: nuclear transport factor 2 family protein [Thermoleophilaceae bacterium]|nr:nuclear transport factor 2 family protein [Thermoleophilaceae bacterium]
MSDSIELLRRTYSAFNASRDVEDVLYAFHPAFRTTVPGELSVEPDTYDGHEGLRRYMASFYEVMDEVDFELVGIEELGEWVIAHSLMHTRARHTGIRSDQEVWLAWRFEDGLALEARPFADRGAALGALAQPE